MIEKTFKLVGVVGQLETKRHVSRFEIVELDVSFNSDFLASIVSWLERQRPRLQRLQ